MPAASAPEAEHDTMPWTEDRFPPAMQHLPATTRAKAIDIANALLAEGMDEGRAIRIAIAKAREWARHHGLDTAWYDSRDDFDGA